MTHGIALPNQKSRISPRVYNHARHEPMRRVLRWLITNIGWRFLAKIERVEGMENFPATGPAILMINHIDFVDPVVVLGNLPRNIVPMAKIEVYDYPVIGIFPRLWGVIPVRRGEVDRRAIEQALAVLKAGEVVLVAPEAHRGPALREAREGIAYLAHKAGVPIIPVAIDGTEHLVKLGHKRASDPGAIVRLGQPFRFKPQGNRPARPVLRQMTSEAMYRLAAMLSEQRRGFYADLSKATAEYIEDL
jgi:1-acyl-sn-glycerol-3-phosphate acyltransferase